MKRDRATELLEGVLVRVIAGESWPLELVDSVLVFGSYARGAPEPGDVDVAVDLNRQNTRWRNHFVHCLSYGRDPYSVVRQTLYGRKRGVSVLFEREGHDDILMVPIWRRGETIDVALERIREIPVDSSAGRAPRHAMLPCFEGMEEWLPRFVREELCDLIYAGIISVDQVKLVEDEVEDPWICSEIATRWGARSPLRRAAHAALAELESRGVDLHAVHLHGRDIDKRVTPSPVDRW